MGYDSDFDLNWAGPADTAEAILTRLADLSGYERSAWEGFQHDGAKSAYVGLPSARWYAHAENLAQLSSEFPEARFELHCAGEDGAQWIVYALGGITETCPGRVEFDPVTLW